MYDVLAKVMLDLQERLTDPEPVLIVLIGQGPHRVHARMNIVAALILIECGELADPPDEVAWQVLGAAHAKGGEGGLTPIPEPLIRSILALDGLQHHGFMVAHEADEVLWEARLELPDSVEDAGAVGAPVDIVAQEHEPVGLSGGMFLDPLQESHQQLMAAVNVADGIG
jgi:hypothetical protein